jgi:hypothetical protein
MKGHRVVRVGIPKGWTPRDPFELPPGVNAGPASRSDARRAAMDFNERVFENDRPFKWWAIVVTDLRGADAFPESPLVRRRRVSGDAWSMSRRCAYCDRPLKRSEVSVDHLLPRSRGGDDSPANLVVCCRQCNDAKGNKTVEEWIDGIRQGAGRTLAAAATGSNGSCGRRGLLSRG